VTQQQLLIVAAVALSNLAVCAWWIGIPAPIARLRDWVAARPARLALVMIPAVAALWLGIFVVYGFAVSGDVTLFYIPQGQAALAGQVPNADFTSWYMPLFAYLMGIVDRIGPGTLAIPLFLTICFVAAGLLLPEVSIRAGIDPATARALVPVALLNGASWVLAIAYQQDECLVLLMTIATLLLLARGRNFSAGMLAGVALLSTKILFVLTAAALATQVRRLFRFAAGGLLVVVPTLAWFLHLGFDPVRMVRGGVGHWAPPSLATLLDVWPAAHAAFHDFPWLNRVPVAAGCLAVLLIFLFVRHRGTAVTPDLTVRAIVAIWLTYLLLNMAALPPYRILIVPFLPTLLELWPRPRWLKATLFGLYCSALGVQWMFFEDWFSRPYGTVLGNPASTPADFMHLACQLTIDSVVVGCEIVWLALCFRGLRWRKPDPAATTV
jgi:hypothetical protein